MRYLLALLACCSGLLAQSPLLDPTSWVWGGRDPDLTFEWHCESTNAEFSRGDATGTLGSSAVIDATAAYDGSYSLSIPSAADYCQFSVAGNDLINPDHGTVSMWVRAEAPTNTVSTLYVTGDTTNYLRIALMSGSTVRLTHVGQGSSRYITTTDTFSANTWFLITAKWQRDVEPYLSVAIDSGTPVTGTTNLVEMNTAPATVQWGNVLAPTCIMQIDNARIYNVAK